MKETPPVIVASVLWLCLLVSTASADEGMWPLYNLGKLPLDELKAGGLELTLEEIYRPGEGSLSDAVVDLGGGTASFVSENGLIITNHHVAYGAIQKQSTIDTNYLRDGFYAAVPSDEIPAIGYNAYVTLAVEDVTDRVLASVSDDMADLEQYQAVDRAVKEIIAECESGRDVRCSVGKMFGGSEFVLYTYFQIRDVRIVYAPPEAIGKYGGEIDNWMWPRHTGDFSFLRAYVAPDGSSAEYAEQNVPYHPKRFLPLSSTGAYRGGLAMMIGFPGRTDRYADSYSLDYLVNVYYPRSIRILEDELAIVEEASARDSVVDLRLASTAAGISNRLKKSRGILEGFERARILEARRQQEKELAAILGASPELKRKYGDVLPELERLHRKSVLTAHKDMMLERMVRDLDYLSMASTIYKWAIEREKDDLNRERRYQDRDTIRTLDRLRHAQINLIPSVDKMFFKYFVRRALELPPDQKINGLEKLFVGVPEGGEAGYLDTVADEFYAKSKIGKLDDRLDMFRMSREDLEALDDPFINLAITLRPEIDGMRERDKEDSGAISRLVPRLLQAYAPWKKDELYPNANGTMRLSYGIVEGYSPRDAVRYHHLSGLTGVMEKESGKDPFIVPEELKESYRNGAASAYRDATINDIPVNFLTTNDGTNGNSGSPIINGAGELIGIDFDTNYECVAKDYMYLRDVSRSIAVDIRYVLFLIDDVYHLDNLVEELTIQ